MSGGRQAGDHQPEDVAHKAKSTAYIAIHLAHLLDPPAAVFLVRAFSNDGGWGDAAGEPSCVEATAATALTLRDAPTTAISHPKTDPQYWFLHQPLPAQAMIPQKLFERHEAFANRSSTQKLVSLVIEIVRME